MTRETFFYLYSQIRLQSVTTIALFHRFFSITRTIEVNREMHVGKAVRFSRIMKRKPQNRVAELFSSSELHSILRGIGNTVGTHLLPAGAYHAEFWLRYLAKKRSLWRNPRRYCHGCVNAWKYVCRVWALRKSFSGSLTPSWLLSVCEFSKMLSPACVCK